MFLCAISKSRRLDLNNIFMMIRNRWKLFKLTTSANIFRKGRPDNTAWTGEGKVRKEGERKMAPEFGVGDRGTKKGPPPPALC